MSGIVFPSIGRERFASPKRSLASIYLSPRSDRKVGDRADRGAVRAMAAIDRHSPPGRTDRRSNPGQSARPARRVKNGRDTSLTSASRRRSGVPRAHGREARSRRRAPAPARRAVQRGGGRARRQAPLAFPDAAEFRSGVAGPRPPGMAGAGGGELGCPVVEGASRFIHRRLGPIPPSRCRPPVLRRELDSPG